MTLPLNSRLSALYDTNGTQKDFSFGFRVFFDPDNGGYGLEVRRQTADGYEVIPKSDYLVLPVEDNSAGVVRFSVAPSAGQQIYIAGKTPTIQQLVLTNFGRYSAESIETQFDFITAIIQEWLSALSEETRQRIAADDILTQYVVQRIDDFVQQVNQDWDDKSQEIEDYIATIMPSFTQTLLEEIEAYAVTGMQDAIDQTLSESKAEIDDAVARANAAATAAAITGKVYDTPEAGVDPVTGVQNGAYYNVRSTDDYSFLDEYQNISGVPTPSGKSYPSAGYVNSISQYTAMPFIVGTSYAKDQRVRLSNGRIVRSTASNNTNNPNSSMAGWVFVNDASQIVDASGLDQQIINDNRTISIKDYLAAGNGTQHKVQDLYTVGSAVYNPRFKNLADVQSFYGSFVDSADYLLDQAAFEKASIDAAAKGGNIVRIQPGVYFYKRLTIRTGVIFWGDDPQSVSLVCVDPNTLDPNVTTHGSSIKKPDDGQRVYRAGFVNMFLSTGAAGTGSNQLTYQKVIGINLCGCERTIMQNVSFAGFGYGALALARAENGAEGLGFVNTAHDGNYNVFDNLSFGSCGRYNPNNAVIWLKYKANSNKFYSIFAKGCTDAFLLVIDRSNDNFVAGGTLESSKGVAHIGLTVAASGNTIIGIRIEGASGDGYIFDTYAANNFVLGGYHTGVTGQDFKLVNPNNRILADNTNYLRNVVFPPITNYSTLHNLAALQVSSINGSVNHPLYIKSEEYNNPLNHPKKVFYNDVINLVAGNILGELAWSNRDTTTGASGESASIQAVAEGSGGETAVIVKTGTGTTAAESLRVKANGTMVNKVNQTANTLTDNNTMNFELISDTQLRIKVRGSDGVTRSATIALT